MDLPGFYGLETIGDVFLKLQQHATGGFVSYGKNRVQANYKLLSNSQNDKK